MSDFSLLFPGKIIFGYGSLVKLKEENIPGKNGLIITGSGSMRKTGVIGRIKRFLKAKKITVFSGVEPELPAETVDNAAKLARRIRASFVIGIGGGSAIDCAKAVSGIFRSKKSIKEYLDGKAKVKERCFFIAVPSTAGTGAEVTKNAVITYTEKQQKISLRGEMLIPDIVIADPQLTLTMPKKITAYTGMDALTQAVESYISVNANDYTKMLSAGAVKLIFDNLAAAYRKPGNKKAREAMLYASLITGLSFANAGLGAVHGIGHPAGSVLKIPHGLVNAVLLPHVVEFNMNAPRKARSARHGVKTEIKELEKYCGKKIIPEIKKLNSIMKIPAKLSMINPGAKALKQRVLEKMVFTGSMAYNPVKMSSLKVKYILDKVI